MKANKRFSPFVLAVAIMTTADAHPPQLYAQTAATELSAVGKSPHIPQWSVQVKMIDPGDVNISASFQIAIYEGLLDELSKTKRFKQVLRDGERSSSGVPDLLILRTTVEKYTAGSETQRAATTVSGATKLSVRSQLCTRDGQILFDRTVRGQVLFMGSNLRATHNLARNVAKTIKQSPLPVPSLSALAQSGQL
jgi:hypothetical protein